MKKHISKFSKLLIAGTVLIFSLAACGGNEDPPKNPDPTAEASSQTPESTGSADKADPTKTEAKSKVEEIKAKGKIIMGTNATFPPFEYVESDGTVVGFDIEIGKKVAEKLGVEYEVLDLPFESLLVNLSAESVDFIVAGMTVKPERLESAEFSDTYFNAKQVVVVMKDNENIKTIDDLKDLRIGVQSSTTGEDISLEISENTVSYSAIAIAAMNLKESKLDALIVDVEPAKGIVKTNDDMKMIELDDFENEDYAIAVKKLDEGNNDLVDVINETLDEIKASGEFDKLVDQFFGE